MYRNLVAEIFVDRLGPAGAPIFNEFKEFVKNRRLDIDRILRGQLPPITCTLISEPYAPIRVRYYIPGFALANPFVVFYLPRLSEYIEQCMTEFPWSSAFLATLLGTFGIIPSPSECDRFLLNGWFSYGTIGTANRLFSSILPTVADNQPQDTTLDRYSHERMLEVACEE